MKNLPLNTNWQFKARDPEKELIADFAQSEGWLTANVPGTVQQDLLAAGKIPDPFYGLNEREVQWVGEQDWLYRGNFDLPPDFAASDPTQLYFEGLDTFATVWLNGEKILVSENMFVPHRIDVGTLLKATANELHILFESAVRRGRELEAKFGKLSAWNGDPYRVYVRKAQYHFGWDWGPCLITCGVWRGVRLESSPVRIAELDCSIEVDESLERATLTAKVVVEATQTQDIAVQLRLLGPMGEELETVETALVENTLKHTFIINQPQLWWPRGYGSQPQYKVEATLLYKDSEVDRVEKKVGLRRLELVQEPIEGETGTSFYFKINNTPIFCGGVNWIPADSFTPRIPAERYQKLLELAADGNMVMLRVWGGGIYEEDIFYDLCDELGLLVWQDFMFACGIYPALDWFQQSVKAEVTATLKRLRHHPSLVLWSGNNEDYMIANSIKAYDATFEGDFTQTSFPARQIYERLLPQLCAELDPARPYWPGSPYGGLDASSQTVGDRHTWDVWHGQMLDYHEYPRFEGRFVSEFGMQAMPDLATVAAFAPPAERYPGSRTFDFHNKATDGFRRLAAYLSDNLPVTPALEDFIYATQLIQSEALVCALRGWRRRWGGPGKYAVGGALIWQINDCYPVTSWAIVDYYLRLKPAYYTVKRELAPITVGLWRSSDNKAALWGVNGTLEKVEAELVLQALTLTGEKVWEEKRALILNPNQATELSTIPFNPEEGIVVGATLYRNQQIIGRATLWPEPFKYFEFSDPAIEITSIGEDKLLIQAKRPAKGVLLTADGLVEWSDNMLDLLPNDPQIITAKGLGKAEVRVRSLSNIQPKK